MLEFSSSMDVLRLHRDEWGPIRDTTTAKPEADSVQSLFENGIYCMGPRLFNRIVSKSAIGVKIGNRGSGSVPRTRCSLTKIQSAI